MAASSARLARLSPMRFHRLRGTCRYLAEDFGRRVPQYTHVTCCYSTELDRLGGKAGTVRRGDTRGQRVGKEHASKFKYSRERCDDDSAISVVQQPSHGTLGNYCSAIQEESYSNERGDDFYCFNDVLGATPREVETEQSSEFQGKLSENTPDMQQTVDLDKHNYTHKEFSKLEKIKEMSFGSIRLDSDNEICKSRRGQAIYVRPMVSKDVNRDKESAHAKEHIQTKDVDYADQDTFGKAKPQDSKYRNLDTQIVGSKIDNPEYVSVPKSDVNTENNFTTDRVQRDDLNYIDQQYFSDSRDQIEPVNTETASGYTGDSEADIHVFPDKPMHHHTHTRPNSDSVIRAEYDIKPVHREQEWLCDKDYFLHTPNGSKLTGVPDTIMNFDVVSEDMNFIDQQYFSTNVELSDLAKTLENYQSSIKPEHNTVLHPTRKRDDVSHPSSGRNNTSHPTPERDNVSYPISQHDNMSYSTSEHDSMSYPTSERDNMSYPTSERDNISHPISQVKFESHASYSKPERGNVSQSTREHSDVFTSEGDPSPERETAKLRPRLGTVEDTELEKETETEYIGSLTRYHKRLEKRRTEANMDKPQTAYDVVMKMKRDAKQKKQTDDQDDDSRVDGDNGESVKALLRRYVPDFTHTPREVMATILRDRILYDHRGPGVVHSVGRLAPLLAKLIDPTGQLETLHLVHRLDKETTGVMLLARTPEMAWKLHEMFRKRQVLKRYWCITKGVPTPDKGLIDIPIRENKLPSGDYRMYLLPKSTVENRILVKRRAGSDAMTMYKVLASRDSAALVECQPSTGIKHQVRVHMAFGMNTPLLGDHKYSHFRRIVPQKLPPDMLSKLGIRQSKVRHIPIHLHAKSVILPEMVDGKNLFFSSRLPKFFVAMIKTLKLKMKR